MRKGHLLKASEMLNYSNYHVKFKSMQKKNNK